MKWYELVFGLCSFVGMIVSIFTLATTHRTKKELEKYRYRVDIKEQLNLLTGIKNSLLNDGFDWQLQSLRTCQAAADRIAILYKGKISDDLKESLASFSGKAIALKRNLSDEDLQEELKNDLSTLTIMLEKELL